MATLCLIAEPFPDWEAPVHTAAARDLANAVAATAPRSCGSKFFIARGGANEPFSSPKISVEQLPMRAGTLPFLWQTNATARPLDGEMTHAITPLIPLRSRTEDDGTQTTVTVPHAIAWEQPELLPASQRRLFKSFVKRAARHADILITTSHATATLLQQHYGHDLPVQVIPPTAPTCFLAGSDATERRARLGLPEEYLITTAHDDDFGRLQWAYNALATDSSLPDLVVITGLDPVSHAKGAPSADGLKSRIPAAIRDRVTVISADVSRMSSQNSKNSDGAGSAGSTGSARVAGSAGVVGSTGSAGSAESAAHPGGVTSTRADSPEFDQVCKDLEDVGAILSGARLLVQPQSFSATGYSVIAALMSQVPVVHAGVGATAEFTIDGGIAESDPVGFATALSRLFIAASGDGTSEMERLTVKAADRGRAFSWESIAWQLWETHATI